MSVLCSRKPTLCASQVPMRLQGVRSVAQHLRADSGARLVVIDTRQELSVHLAGRAYMRREAEMPTVAMHHAGVPWREVRKLEQWLLEDTRASAEDWATGGMLRVLVHREAKVRRCCLLTLHCCLLPCHRCARLVVFALPSLPPAWDLAISMRLCLSAAKVEATAHFGFVVFIHTAALADGGDQRGGTRPRAGQLCLTCSQCQHWSRERVAPGGVLGACSGR